MIDVNDSVKPVLLKYKTTKKPLRFHMPGLHHTQTRKFFTSCAFTVQILDMCEMLTKMGHTVYHYGNNGSNPMCTEHIDISTREEFLEAFSETHYRRQTVITDGDNANTGWQCAPEFSREFDRRVVAEIEKRLQPNDFILNMCSTSLQDILNPFEGRAILCEPGVGYGYIMPNTHRAYVSHVWEGFHTGKKFQENNGWHNANPTWQDAVIHYFADPNDFTYNEDKENFAFFIGRFNHDKGPETTIQVIEEYRNQTGDDMKLIMAGSGHEWLSERPDIKAKEWLDIKGFIEPEERRELLSKAKVLLAPSWYLEPFGIISIEAQMSGTPAIGPDWGGFVESIIHGKTGFRCRTFEEFVFAVKNINTIKPQDCRTWSVGNFSTLSQARKYEHWFQSLYNQTVDPAGWYAPNKERTELEWLESSYPI